MEQLLVKKGLVFPNDKYNQRYPHIGMVLIGNNSEIGAIVQLIEVLCRIQ